ncbi:MAG: hypothetical protein ACE5EN_11610, partial [Nitrospinota bacterium]
MVKYCKIETPGRSVKEDIGKFKTPTLRHVEQTWPYMHNGVFDDLDQLLAFYNAGGGRVKTKRKTTPSIPLL